MIRVTNPETGKFRTFQMTEGEYHELCEAYEGLCVRCGEVRETCEPDARRYKCDACGGMTAYGTEELMLMGRVEIVAVGGQP